MVMCMLMVNFLEDFATILKSKENEMKEKMLKGIPNPLQADFEKQFHNYWISLQENNYNQCDLEKQKIIAVDSSIYTNLMSTGGLFYIIRSMAVCREKICKRIETDVIFSKDQIFRVRNLIGRKMELLEFKVAIDFLKKEEIDCKTLLIDGSLHGRSAFPPIETKTQEENPTLIEYYRTYKELLDICKRKNVLLIGVSKQSRSNFYRDFILEIIFNEKLKKTDLEPKLIAKLRPLFFKINEDEKKALYEFDKLKHELGKYLQEFELILDELVSSRPDYQLIMNLSNSPGYTKPLILGTTTRMHRYFNNFLSNPRGYIEKHFPRSTREKGEKFLADASSIVSEIPNFPSFISLYLLLNTGDSPLRIDTPNWNQPILKTGWPKPSDIDVEDLLGIMQSGYCGLDGYNLWLKDVDQKVRLRKKIVDKIYFPYMERIFNEKIIRGRSYRRVKYP